MDTIKLELTHEQFNHIIAALLRMHDSDYGNGKLEDAEASADLIDYLRRDRHE